MCQAPAAHDVFHGIQIAYSHLYPLQSDRDLELNATYIRSGFSSYDTSKVGSNFTSVILSLVRYGASSGKL